MEKILQLAIELSGKAGKELLKQFNNFDRSSVRLKSKHEIVTQSDIISEDIIIKGIKKRFPDHTILSEESGLIKSKGEYMWIVDPLDGTTNFSIHNPLFATSIGVVHNGELVVGVVYAPFLNELYFAVKGAGSFFVGNDFGKRMYVSKIKDGKVLNTFCHGSRHQDIKKALHYYNQQKLNKLDCRQLGSAAIELAYVAMGRTESITIPGANIWDVAAGVILVREAGGRVTDFSNQEWQLQNGDILASNGLIHTSILKALK